MPRLLFLLFCLISTVAAYHKQETPADRLVGKLFTHMTILYNGGYYSMLVKDLFHEDAKVHVTILYPTGSIKSEIDGIAQIERVAEMFGSGRITRTAFSTVQQVENDLFSIISSMYVTLGNGNSVQIQFHQQIKETKFSLVEMIVYPNPV